MENIQNEAEFKEIILDLIQKSKHVFGEKLIVSDFNRLMINKGVKTEEESLQPKWKQFLLSQEFTIFLRNLCEEYDSRNNS
ncbi:MAG: hypothetical protein ACC656_14765 [Candidatus Heimdallarchaeota archaeon]